MHADTKPLQKENVLVWYQYVAYSEGTESKR